MSITIKETTSKGDSFGPASTVNAKRTFEALCTAGETAMDIRAQLYAEKGIAINSLYMAGVNSLCQSVACDHRGGGVWDVVATFSPAPQGAFPTHSDNLAAPVKVKITTTLINDRTDRDADGNPFYNAARIPFEGGQEVALVAKRLTITKNYARAQVSTFAGIENTVNSGAVKLNKDALQLDATIEVPADCMWCIGVEPMEYALGAAFIPHQIIFEWRIWYMNGSRLEAPFDYRFRNESRIGLSDRGNGPFCNADGTLLSTPQLLAGDGSPVDGTVKVRSSIVGVPVAPRPCAAPPVGASFEAGDQYVRYKRYARSDFLGPMAAIFGSQA